MSDDLRPFHLAIIVQDLDVAREFYSLLVYGIIIMSLSILNYRKTN